MLWIIFLAALKLFFAAVVISYARIVVIALRTQGPHYQVQHNWHDPAHTVESFLVWAGVRIASRTLRLLQATLNSLEEASAEVGEWILNHR